MLVKLTVSLSQFTFVTPSRMIMSDSSNHSFNWFI